MSESEAGPSRITLSPEDFINIDKEQLVEKWCKQERYLDFIESQLANAGPSQLCETEDKPKQSVLSNPDSARRESSLLMRLNSKEQEIQDLIVQIQELKTSQANNHLALKSSILDPAVNLLVQQLRKELENAKSSLEETQNELSAWKFTPDSNTGKRLMAKCRLLYQENEELGRMISSGRLAKLEGDLALQRNFSEEMKKSQSELDEFLLELDEDVEGMQSTIYFLQQQLRQARDQLLTVQRENDLLRDLKGKCGEISHIDNHSDELIIDDGLVRNSYPSRGENAFSDAETSNSLDNRRECKVDSKNLATVIDKCAVYSLEKYEEVSRKLSAQNTESIDNKGESNTKVTLATMCNELIDIGPALDNTVVSIVNQGTVKILPYQQSSSATSKENSETACGMDKEIFIKSDVQPARKQRNSSADSAEIVEEPCLHKLSDDTATRKENENINASNVKREDQKTEEGGPKGHKRTGSQVEETSGHFSSARNLSDPKIPINAEADFSEQDHQASLKIKRRRSSADANDDHQ